MIAIALTPEAYGEVRAKLVALCMEGSRVTVSDGLEMLIMDECFFTKEEGEDKIDVFISYKGKLLKDPGGKDGLDNL